MRWTGREWIEEDPKPVPFIAHRDSDDLPAGYRRPPSPSFGQMVLDALRPKGPPLPTGLLMVRVLLLLLAGVCLVGAHLLLCS